MSKFFFLLMMLSLFFVSCSNLSKKEQVQLPNIVLFFIDDMGYGDAACYGATGYSTPYVDKLASQGMRFTNFYAAQPVCSASRAGLLTGCYPNRIGFSGALFPHHKVGLNPDETTMAEMLKQKGYATAAIGKWHLGHLRKFLPLQHGFDEFFGLPYSNDMWPIDEDGNPAVSGNGRGRYPDLPLLNGNDPVGYIKTLDDQNRLTTLYTEKAVDFINRKAGQPFFLYLPHSMGHVPLGVSEKFKGKSEQGMYGDVMMEIDWSLGQVMDALEANGLSDNTIVIFTSDNGPWLNYGNHAGSAGGLREGKLTNWEGGQRVPFVVKWPGEITEGSICNKLGCAIDLLPTFADITNAQLPEKKIDGVSLNSLWKGDFKSEPRKELWYYFGKNNLIAVRKGNWKLVLPHSWGSYDTPPGMDGHGGKKVGRKINEPELYNMMRDPGEQYNVIDHYPDKEAELMQVVEEARSELGDLSIGLSKGVGNREIGSE